MCHFITAALPKEADVTIAQQIFEQHKLGFKEIENQSVSQYLDKGDLYILTTRGMCDCGTLLASGHTENEAFNRLRYEEESVKKFKSKGWSDTKIRRWLNEAELTRQKQEQKEELAHETALTAVDDWLNFIRDILSSGATNRVGLLVHLYDGGLGSRIKIIGKGRIPVSKLTAEFLVNMREDVIYDFVS